MRKYILPLISVVFMILAVIHVVIANQVKPSTDPPAPPAMTPFQNTVSGAGLIEPETENIAIGSHLPGVVAEVFVKEGRRVAAGEVLFRLDDRQLAAELAVREANLAAAQAQLTELDKMPRPEDLPASEARVREARAMLTQKEDTARRYRRLLSSRAVGEEEVVKAEQEAQASKEQLARAQADYDLLRAGAWEPDKAIARATVAQARSQVEQTRTELERLKVKAPVDGEVLQVNVRPGEFVGAPPGQALIVLGSVDMLHVRIDIDEHDIPRYRPGAAAYASVRGRPTEQIPLTFVRVEPYVIPKKSLTGNNQERVDTRVLQVIYALDTSTRPV